MSELERKLLEALKQAADWMEEELKNIGGCDHSVGICCCGDYSMLESFRELIAKAEGKQ